MGATIQGTATSIPFAAKRAVIGVGGGPGSAAVDLDLQLLECRVASASVGPGHLTFKRRMGTVHSPHGSAFATKSPDYTMLGKWATFRISGASGIGQAQFTGVIVTESSVLKGTDEGSTGEQQWTALDPLHLLEREQVAKTYSVEGTGVSAEVTLTRVAPFNLRDAYGTLVGNRSDSTSGETYVFGGSSLWTRRQALDYLLGRFAPTSQGTWSVGGATGLLDVAADAIDMGQVGSLASAVKQIVSPQIGLDFQVHWTATGFEVRVFSLVDRDVSLLGYTLPANRAQVAFVAGERHDVRSVRFERTLYRRYSKIRILGERAVVCFSLSAADGDLVKKWGTASETTYKAGTGTSADAADLHDAARRAPQLGNVYSVFGAPHPFALSAVGAGVEFDAEGELAGVGATHQSLVRRTEAWIPLREGYDYTTGSEVSASIDAHEGDLQRPMAWVQDPETSRYVTVEEAGAGLSVPRNDWGVILRARDAHKFALNHLDTDDSGTSDTLTAPAYDYETLTATLAVRTDQRLSLEVELGAEGDGTTLEVGVPGAEYWLAAAGTVVGVAASDGSLVTLPSQVELRNDRDALAAFGVGIVASYLMSSASASVELQGLQPYGSVVGSMLTQVVQGATGESIAAPITSVLYTADDTPGSSDMTYVQAGYQQ